MAKFKPGIPDGFSLDVEPVRDLGDYLDEPSPVTLRNPKPRVVEGGEGNRPTLPPPKPVPVASSPAPATERPEPPAPIALVARPPAGEPPIPPREERVIPRASQAPATPEPIADGDRIPRPKGPRREISMRPETLRMSDELLDLIQSGSGQRDTKPNELFHALVLLVHEAMDEFDPHAIPKRGRWGTPTSRAYPLELKNAFRRALLRKYGTAPERAIGQRYPATGAAYEDAGGE